MLGRQTRVREEVDNRSFTYKSKEGEKTIKGWSKKGQVDQRKARSRSGSGQGGYIII